MRQQHARVIQNARARGLLSSYLPLEVQRNRLSGERLHCTAQHLHFNIQRFLACTCLLMAIKHVYAVLTRLSAERLQGIAFYRFIYDV